MFLQDVELPICFVCLHVLSSQEMLDFGSIFKVMDRDQSTPDHQ